MSKKDGTAAAANHPPADKGSYTKDQPHARAYPGRKAPKGAKVVEGGSHNAKELAAGRSNSMGASANGSHKGLPASREYVGHDGYDTSKDAALGKPRDVAASAKHDAEELAAGRTNSMGTSADGSHKGLPLEYPVIRQNGGR